MGLERRRGYQHVYTPELGKRQLYEQSGHWDHYQQDMYPPMRIGDEEVVLRPMNCPHHILVFAAEPRSIRAMPVRLAELGTMFRRERSGVVGGLSRVRQMTLNDGHVFCAPEHIGEELASLLGMVAEAYRALAIPPPGYRLSLRGDGPKYVGSRSTWDRSEAMLRVLEVHDGALPPWLAPTQVVVAPIVDDALEHARRVRQRLQEADVRVELDDRDATLGSRIRDARQRRIPYVAVVGRREAENATVAVRLRDSTQLEPQSVEAFIELLARVRSSRSPGLVPPETPGCRRGEPSRRR